MKLLTYDNGTGPRCGALQDDAVVDAAALIGSSQPLADVRLRAPVLQPPTVRDYIIHEEHATSQGGTQRRRQVGRLWRQRVN